MAQLLTVRLNKSDQQPLGFRLQGGKDFGTPLVVQKVNGGSAAERAGLQAGDALIRVNATDVYSLRHQEAQDTIRAAGANLELTVQRGGGTWRPSVTPTGSLPRPGSRPLGTPTLVTNTSLKASPKPSLAFGSGHNNVAKPFGYMNGNDSVKSIVNNQYNTPVKMYSDKTIAETLSAQTEVLAGGVLGVNFKKNEKTYDAEKSAVFKVLQEEQNDPEPEAPVTPSTTPVSGLRHVQAPVTRPDAPINNTGGLPPGQNICEECERLITRRDIGVFVRIKDKNLHVECFKCSTCGSSLKNQGYYNLNGKLYCDIHAKLVARQNPPAPNLEPVTVPPGGRLPTNSYSTPLPPLATNNYSNGSSSLFSPSSNLSGPKPFGSSIGSAYSPASLSPRSAPLSPARPAPAPAPAPPAPAAPFAPTQNVKSIVWPPPANLSDDEPPKYEPALKTAAPLSEQELPSVNKIKSEYESAIANMQKNTSEPTMNKTLSEYESNIATQQQAMETTVQKLKSDYESNIQQQLMEPSVQKIRSEFESSMANMQQQSVTSSKQMEEYSSSISYSSAAMSSVTASSKSESVVQSKQSQVSQETSSKSIQSYSQESSQCQSTTIYQTQSYPHDQNMVNMELPATKLEKQAEKTESKKEIHSTFGSETQTGDIIKTSKESEICQNYQNKTRSENGTVNTSSETQNVADLKTHEHVQDKNTQSQTNTESTKLIESNKENKSVELSNIMEASAAEISLSSAICSSTQQNVARSMVEALTTAPDRPYSPLPPPPQPINTMGQNLPQTQMAQPIPEENSELQNISEPMQLPEQPSPMFSQEAKRGITPIPPIKQYNPPGKVEPPIPMPEQTKPYIPPDFKITIEPKAPRNAAASPLVDALTTAPTRPFTPTSAQIPNSRIERGSLRDALTIAPDRPFSPFGSVDIQSESTQYMTSTTHVTETNLTDIVRPIATQTSTQFTDKVHSEFSAMQNTCQLQSSSEMSAFRPVPKQVFPPPLPDEFNMMSNFPPVSNDTKTSFTKATKTKQETSFSDSMMVQQSSLATSMATQGYSSVKMAQNYFEQLDKKESMSSTAVRSKSGLHKPDNIPPYQRNFDQLPSQRGLTPEIYNAPAVLQRPVTPTTNPPTKPKDKSVEPNTPYIPPQAPTPKIPQIRTPVHQPPVQFHKDSNPITMTFQPVTDDNFMRVSPSRSRPNTPSLINKPAPIIPHYQMNLVSVEHLAPESHLHEPSSREGSRSPTPKPRSRSPAQGPPPNPLKAQAPRIKESTPQYYSADTYASQDNYRRQQETAQKDYQNTTDLYPTGAINWRQNQPVLTKEHKHSNVEYKSENYTKGNAKVKEDSMLQENYGQRQMQSQNVVEQGSTTIHTTRKTFEEFERTQSAKVIEIRKGGSSFSGAYGQMDSNIRSSNTNPKQVFPPPVMSLPPSQQSSSFNPTNQNIASASRTIENCDPKPSISGANQGPVCDPTPSTGPSVGGGAARGKTFGVSSAPKRGRGVLNKPALPGSRVPLCGSCNGNIRGPFITALGRIWCPDHFICVNATCRRPLQDIGFVEENGQLYCEFCFEQYIAPACDKCHAKIKGIGMTCSRQNVSLAASRWKLATGGSRRSTITTTVSASTARCAKRTSKDRASSPREADLFAKLTPAKSPQRIMYNSDTVYSTTAFRPVSPSPITPPKSTPSPQRTRKLETPLHFDGGLFSDIRSTDGKLLSKVTVDRVHRSTRHDITDSPSVTSNDRSHIEDLVKTETITNEDVITVKFTPVPLGFDSPRLLTPSQMQREFQQSPVEYIKDNYEDLQSYKIVNSLCKEKLFEKDSLEHEINIGDKLSDSLDVLEPVKRGHSPLANLLISEQLTKIDSYLQESLEVCSGVKERFTPTINIEEEFKMENIVHDGKSSHKEEKVLQFSVEPRTSKTPEMNIPKYEEKVISEPMYDTDIKKDVSKHNSVSVKHPGLLSAIYNMPIHYHAAILCFLLIIYNLIYQYIKQNCHGNKK